MSPVPTPLQFSFCHIGLFRECHDLGVSGIWGYDVHSNAAAATQAIHPSIQSRLTLIGDRRQGFLGLSPPPSTLLLVWNMYLAVKELVTIVQRATLRRAQLCAGQHF
mmetsp:Transcript_28133/g.65404  ORF Transcript_28133/g.65404 Transcript_28133/m.65404 type:complete len:107 (+) Transcript_28133:918-1238(+)